MLQYCTGRSLSDVIFRMAKAVSKEKKGFRSQCDLITKLVSGCLSTLKESETQERQDIEAWRRQRIDEALRKTDMFSKADAPFLAKVVTCYPGEALFQRYVLNDCPLNVSRYVF
jgi:thioester reductase-like protein